MKNVHNYLQSLAALMFSGGVWGLTHNVFWGLIVLASLLLSWSVLAELSGPPKRKDNATDLRSVA